MIKCLRVGRDLKYQFCHKETDQKAQWLNYLVSKQGGWNSNPQNPYKCQLGMGSLPAITALESKRVRHPHQGS